MSISLLLVADSPLHKLVPRNRFKMAEKLGKIINTRKGHLTRAINSLEDVLTSEVINESEVKKYVESVTLKFKKLEEESEKLIDELEDQDSIDRELNTIDKLQDKVTDLQIRAKEILDHSSKSHAKGSTAPRFQSPKLPELEIEKFNGELEKYQEFIDAFTATIDNNPKLDAVDKFRYLRMYLDDNKDGDGPKSLIAGFSTTADNYKEALNIIKETYGKKERIIMSHVSKLLTLETYEKFDKSSLRCLYNKVKTQIRQLEVLDITSEQYSIFLVPIVLSKLTHLLRVQWSKYKKEEDINELLEFMQIEIESLEDARQVECAFANDKEKSSTKKNYSEGKYNQKSSYSHSYNTYNNRPSSASALSTVAKKKCIFCPKASDHYVDHCKKVSTLSVEDRRQILLKENGCYCCLKRGHRKQDCYALPHLSCEICKKPHHTLLHDDKVTGNVVCASCTNEVLMPVVKGRILGPTGKQLEINILLDPASDQSFIDSKTSEVLQLKGRNIEISIGGITGHIDKAQTRKVVKAVVKNRHHLEKYKEVELIELPVIVNNMNRPAVNEEVLQSKYIKNLQLADDYTKKNDCDINVLLGLTNYYSVVSGKTRRSPEKPIAIETIFGWMLVSDSSNTCEAGAKIMCMLTTTKQEKEISEQIRKFWEIEEISSENKLEWSTNDRKTFDKFEKSLKFENNKYTVKLPIVENLENDLYNNKELSKNRFLKKLSRFKKDSKFKEKYEGAVTEYINAGYAEKVNEKEEQSDSYYIPHQVVIKEESTSTKYRLVFDGSASEKGEKSINDKLEKGPVLQPLLNSILLRFRLHKIAITSDVKKMYLMIAIAEEDRDKLRFIWKSNENNQLEIYRNCVLPFGLKSSPFLAIGVVQHHLKKYESTYPYLINELIKSTYVDDLLTGVETESDALNVYETTSKIMKEAGMDMRKWNSNNEKVKKTFENDGVAAESNMSIGSDLEDTFKLLGIVYSPDDDKFQFKSDKIIEKVNKSQQRITKRVILSVSSMLYDPMGWLCPFIINAKLIIQMLWESGVEWDEAVPHEIENQWRNWIKDLVYLEKLKIPRRYTLSPHKVNYNSSEIHTFGDASEAAYGAVTYLKTYDEYGNVEVSLMYSKSKVAPIKKVTLPRLELQAALLGAKMSSFIKNEINIPEIKTYLWTDSSITLHWIKSKSKQYKTYIANRVQQIQELSDPSEWGWCPGDSNPADLPSRGMSMCDLVKSTKWWGGPSWLKQNSESYPKFEENTQPPEELLEKKVLCMVIKSVSKNHSKELRLAGELINPAKYSRFLTLIKTTAYISKYMFNLRHPHDKNVEPINAEDIRKSTNYWLHRIQKDAFSDEISKLMKKQTISKESKLVKLSPYYDETDSLIKMGGRIQYSELSETEKHPIILPYDSELVKILIKDIHIKHLHSGINHTLIAVRERFWILKARKIVRSIVKSCIICRKYSPVRMKVPMAPLPYDRVNRAYPFQVCGVDFTGPIYVSAGKSVEKSYIVLYTCANIRAIHLELVADQTTESFLRSFRRMTNRRGMISTFYSDNSKTFKSSSKEMQRYVEIMNGKKFQGFLAEKEIEWKFIVDYAAWWGGFYERMMRSIKLPLKKILGRSVYSSDEIYTILTEVEAMVNSRPLTYVSDEPDEINYLTPASFLIGRRLINVPVVPVNSTEKSLRKKELKNLMIMQNNTLNLLWKTWREEYVRNLGTVPTNVSDEQCVAPGELVMVAEASIPRTKWTVGIVKECKTGRDGKVRTVRVKTASGEIMRSVQHLSRLEMDSE